jgi:hypothetical protein
MALSRDFSINLSYHKSQIVIRDSRRGRTKVGQPELDYALLRDRREKFPATSIRTKKAVADSPCYFTIRQEGIANSLRGPGMAGNKLVPKPFFDSDSSGFPYKGISRFHN